MKKLIIILCGLAIAGSAFAGNVKSYRVYFSTHGSRHTIIVRADSSWDARDTVRHMFPSVLVTNVIPVK
jgi:glycine cleavage system regulatory protein